MAREARWTRSHGLSIFRYSYRTYTLHRAYRHDMYTERTPPEAGRRLTDITTGFRHEKECTTKRADPDTGLLAYWRLDTPPGSQESMDQGKNRAR